MSVILFYFLFFTEVSLWSQKTFPVCADIKDSQYHLKVSWHFHEGLQGDFLSGVFECSVSKKSQQFHYAPLF